MGRGGGPITIPEAVIEEAFNKGEDFTISENEIAILTEPLEVPTGRTLLVEGTIDLGGNILNVAVGSTLKLDGGTLTNAAGSELNVDGNVEAVNSNINTPDTTVTVNAGGAVNAVDTPVNFNGLEVEAAGSVSTRYSGANRYQVTMGTATVAGALEVDASLGAVKMNFNNLALTYNGTFDITGQPGSQDEQTTVSITNTMTVATDSVLSVTDAVVDWTGVTAATIAGGLTMTTTATTGTATSTGAVLCLGIEGTEGFTMNITGNANSITNASYPNYGNRIEGGTINLTEGGKMSGVYYIKNTKFNIGEEGTADGSVLILGDMNEAGNEFTTKGSLTYDEEADVKVYNEEGIKFVKDSIISEGVTFPQGTATESGGVYTYPLSDNEGFDISSTGGGGIWPTVVEYDGLNSSTTKEININMAT
jgi:hypothetical protein